MKPRTACLRATLLTACLGAAGHAAELAWPADADGAALPAGWEFTHSAAAKDAAASFAHGSLVLRGDTAHYAHLVRALGGVDGTDQAPLRVECRIATASEAELGGPPTAIALYWGPGNAIAVGLGGWSQWLERWEPQRRRGWSMWQAGAEHGSGQTEGGLFAGAAPSWFRLVVATRDVSAFASTDGLHWQALGSCERAPGRFAGAPAQLIVGRGWIGDRPEQQQPLLANDLGDPGQAQATAWTVSDLVVTTAVPALPAVADYRKPKSWDEAREAQLAGSQIRRWSLLGPLAPSDKPYGPEKAVDAEAAFRLVDGSTGHWQARQLDESAGPTINFKNLLKVTGQDQICYAVATIPADADREERLLFDGTRRIWVYVNGHPVANGQSDPPNVQPDRLAASAPLRKGDNQVVVKVAAHNWDLASMFTLRHEPAALPARIAWLARVAADLPEDAENGAIAVQESARLWEAQGLLLKAAETLGALLAKEGATPAQVEAACFERARLHRLLRDRDAVVADVQELAKRRLAAKGGDGLEARLTVAQLWDQMGFPDKGLEALDQQQAPAPGAPAAAAVSAEVVIAAGLARARLHQVLKQDDQVPADLRAIAAQLAAAGAGDSERAFAFSLQALAIDLAAGREGAAAALLTAAAAAPHDGPARVARVQGVLAGASEARGDQPGRLAHLQQVLANRRTVESSWESLHVELAEALLSGAPAEPAQRQAIEHYRQALALCAAGAEAGVQKRRAAADQALADGHLPEALQGLRSAYARACLAESAAGARMLARADGAPAPAPGSGRNLLLAPLIRDFAVIGPFDNKDFACYDKPPVVGNPAKRGHVEVGKDVQGVKWLHPGLDAYQDGVLDLLKLYNHNDCVAFAYREIDALAPGDAELSCGADDGLVLWFNGKKVHEDRQSRAVKPGDIIVPVRLEAGANTLLAMIQQGNGDWGVTISITSAGAQAIDLAQVLGLLERSAESRPAVAAACAEMVGAALKAGQADEAVALARLLARAFPERPELQLAAIDRLLAAPERPADSESEAAAPRLGPELVEWLEGYGERRGFAGKDAFLAGFRPRAAAGLRALGDFAGAAAVLRRIQVTAFDGDAQTRVLAELGELYRIAGYPRTAADYLRRAGERPIGDEALRRQVRDGLFLVRGAKGDNAAFEASLDAATMVQTADRAIAAGDLERGLRTYQRALDGHAAELVKLDGGIVVGVGEYIADRLHGLGADATAAYRKLYDSRAKDQLQQARAAGDAGLLAQVARTYPGSSVAGDALVAAADLLSDAGSPRRAAALLTQALAARPADAAAAPLVAKLAQACLQAGDWAGARAALARLAAPPCAGASLTVRGAAQSAADFAAALQRTLAAGEQPGQVAWPTVGGSPLRRGASGAAPLPVAVRTTTVLPVHPAEQMAADRFAPAPWQQLMMHAASDGRTAWLHTLDETFAIDLASGALRWRSPSAFPGLRRGLRQDAFAGLPETMTTVADGRVYARALHRSGAGAGSGAAYAVEARDAASGALRWSSESEPATATASAVSSPACSSGVVVAVFQQRDERSRSFVAAFAAADGRLLWRTPLAFGLASLTLTSQQEIYLGDHLAAPSIAGGDVYLATDAGSVVDLDLGDGAVRWAATYPRALLDGAASRSAVRQLAGRAASRVVVGDELLYVAPRDTLAVLAIARANGAMRWKQELSDARAVIGLTAGGAGAAAGLVLEGRGVECLGAAGGERRWRWTPAGEDQLYGLAAIGGASVYVPTRGALVRLAAEDGRAQASDAWAKLGLDAPLGNLVLLDGAVLGTGPDRLVALQDKAGAAAAPVIVPGDVGDAALPLSGLPAAEFAAPLAQRWRLGDGAGAVVRPGDAEAGDLYLDLGDRLVRMDADGGKIVWQAPMAPGLLRSEVADGRLLTVHPRSLAAFDLASGRLLWSHALPYDDPGFFVETENREDRRPYGQVAAGGGLVAVWSRTRRHVELLNSASGAAAGGVDLPAEPRWIGLSAAGEVIAVLMRGDHGAIEGRDARSGAQTWRLDLPLTERNPRRFASILSADRNTVYLCADRNMAAVDLAQHKLAWSVPTSGGEDIGLHLDGGLLVIAAHQGDSWRNQALDPAAGGKTVFDGEVYKGWRPYLADSFRFVGDRAIGMNDQRGGGHPTVVCRSLSGNKELWSADLGDAWHHRCVGFQAAGKYLAVLEHPEDDLRLRYLLLDLETGRPAGSGMLPGTDVAHRETAMPTAFVAGQLVYAAREGVCAVGGLPPPPAGRLAMEAALDQVRATAGLPGPAHEGASEFTALYRPDTRPALFTRQALRIDGQLDDWTGDEAIALGEALDVRGAPGGAWGGAQDLSAKARVAWDRRFVYLAVETTDDRHEPPAPGGSPLDGDSVVVGIDPQGSNAGEQAPLVLALSLVDGRTRVTQISGAPLPLPDAADEAGRGDEDRVAARAVRKAAGCTYELAIPWAALRANPGERPGYRLAMGLGVAVVDWDGGKPKSALEWGYGLMRGIAANRMARIQFVDLTPERIAGYRKFIALMPTHEYAWRFVERIAATHIGPAGLPGRIGEIEGYIAANPAGVHTATAIAELERLYRSGGSAEPGEQAAKFALKAGVAPRLAGDAVGPGAATGDQGRAIRQWVRIDPAHPADELMVEVRSTTEDWRRAQWGQDLLPWGEPGTAQRWPRGPLPKAGEWVALTVPLGALRLDGHLIDSIGFASYGGSVAWGRSEYLEDGKVQVIMDGDLPKGANWGGGVSWTDQPAQDGKRSHGMGLQTAESEHRLGNGGIQIDLRAKTPPPAAPAERLQKDVEAAKLIPETEEALYLLREAEGQFNGQPEDQRLEHIIAMYADFLKSDPANQQAARVLTTVRFLVEGWNDNRKVPPKRAAALARCEALMDEVKLGREPRRQFYGELAAPLGEWKVVGFFDAPKGAQALQEALPPERGAVDLDARYPTLRGGEVGWTDARADANALNPASRLRDKEHRRGAVAYAYTRLEAPASAEAALFLGLRGQALVWINGKRVGALLTGEGTLQRDAFALPCKLVKGANEILVKLSGGEGGAPLLTARIADLNGKPLEGLVARLPPTLVAASAGNPTAVTVEFSGPLDPAGAEDPASYAVDHGVTVTKAALVGKERRSVALTLSPLTPDTEYALTVSNVKNATGTPLRAGAHTRFHLLASGVGSGLKGEFFSGHELKELLTTRSDETIDFEWGDGEQPDPAVPSVNWSARWSGQVMPLFTDTWTFTTLSDDGARLWIDGKLVVDAWRDQPPTEATGTIALEAGRRYDLKLEYYQGGASAAMKLMWQCSRQDREVIPKAQLFPGPAPADAPAEKPKHHHEAGK